MINEKSAGAVVFYRGAQIEYLLLFSTYWGFAKGRIEPGEDEPTAAFREVREETGLDTVPVEGFGEIDKYTYKRKGEPVEKQIVYFIAEARTRNARISHEHTALVWLPFDAALTRLNYAGGRAILQKVNEFLLNQKT